MTGYDLPHLHYWNRIVEAEETIKALKSVLNASTVFIYTLIALSWINSVIWWAG